ncbi:hypothetical protein FNF_09213 [Fusobacterium necrophorum subsp. funduliforme B35]|uniref:ABC transporter permease n=1 Tax=Fusobacterium necrophorum subsp. funduliforme B35 TaxID=1226633 RepID=A0A017H2P1_9FUSO|nr:ABC transporter permease [Fusobacterium necrophorum]EYD68535.1 hypothetical protein FNF_09213 [Fusobacterium necrophorum subsp. funduliforme B35]KID50356.1 hypothetical protein C095_00300 [Fusobacterium necrophorum subsp. funduliforme B35]
MNRYFNAFKYEILTDLIISKNYMFSFFMDIFIFTGLLSFFILSGSGYKFTVYYSKDFNYKEIILLGYIVWILSLSLLNTICSEIRTENIQGTLESKFMSILPFPILLFAKLLSSLFIQIIEITVVLLVSKFVFDLSIRMSASIILLIIFIYVGMYGFSLTIGSLILSRKKIGQLNLIIQIALLVFSNVFTTTNLSIFSYILPLGIGNHLLHLSYLGFPISYVKILIFFTSCFLWLLLGQVLFNKAIKYTKEKGSLGIY